MYNNIEVIITINSCDKLKAVIGNFANGRLYIDILSIPQTVHIIVDKPFGLKEIYQCLAQLKESLNSYSDVSANGSLMVFHNTSRYECVFGATLNDSIMYIGSFTKTSYFIEYSFCNLI